MSASAQDPVEAVDSMLIEARELAALGCRARARATVAAAREAAAGLGSAPGQERLEGSFQWAEETLERLSGEERDAGRYRRKLEGFLESYEGTVEQVKEDPDDGARHAPATLRRLRAMLEDEECQDLLEPEVRAGYEQKVAAIQAAIDDARLGARHARAERLQQDIQEVLDGTDTSTYTETVEKWFRQCREVLGKCPADEARTREMLARLEGQREAYQQALIDQARAELLDPAVAYWTYLNETYAGEAEGWESEGQVTSVRAFTNTAPPSLGCPRTEHLLREVVARWFEDDRVKEAAERFPTAPSFQPTHDEATRLREEAGRKVCEFANALLSEAEQLPAGQERDEFQGMLGELQRVVSDCTQGSTGCERTLTRIQAVDRRWRDEREQGEADRAALLQELDAAANAAWPELIAGLVGEVKELDAADALARPDAWQGTVVRFTGGARGVNLNRSGWNYQDEYDFIVEPQEGIPVCGNFDGGLAMGLKAFSAETGVEPDTCEECLGIVEGTCRVWERVQHPLDRERYVRGRQLEAVRLRIVAWKACTVAVCAGVGTSLAKFRNGDDVYVPDMGRAR